jgi:hypothetical protein
LWVGGIVGLLVESSLQEAGGDGGLAWASVLTAPEASELGGLYCITWHGKLEEVSTGEDCSGEGRSESEDFSSPFEDLLVHSLQLERRRGDKLAGVCEPRNEGALQDIDFAVDRSWPMTDGVEVPIKLELVMVKLRLLFRVQVILAAKVRERSRLPKRDVRVVDSEDERRSWRLLGVGSVV